MRSEQEIRTDLGTLQWVRTDGTGDLYKKECVYRLADDVDPLLAENAKLREVIDEQRRPLGALLSELRTTDDEWLAGDDFGGLVGVMLNALYEVGSSPEDALALVAHAGPVLPVQADDREKWVQDLAGVGRSRGEIFAEAAVAVEQPPEDEPCEPICTRPVVETDDNMIAIPSVEQPDTCEHTEHKGVGPYRMGSMGGGIWSPCRPTGQDSEK